MRYWLARLRLWVALRLMDPELRAWVIAAAGRQARFEGPPARYPFASLMAGILFIRYVEKARRDQ